MVNGQTSDGRRLDGYTISSPCEPNGSGELKECSNHLENVILMLGEKVSFP